MKREAFLPYLFSFLCGLSAFYYSVEAVASGEPGCLRTIQSGPMNEAMAKRLSKSCQTFRKRYFSTLTLYLKDPNRLIKELQSEVGAQKSLKNPEAPYDALLFASLIQETRLIPEITKRAQAEKKLNAYYRFGAALLEKMSEGRCHSFTGPIYAEICNPDDRLFERAQALRLAKNEMAAKKLKEGAKK